MECETIYHYDADLKPVMKPKQKFDTLDDAIERAKQVNSKDHVIHKVVAYKCTLCHKYHLGRNGKELTDKDRDKFKRSRI